MTRRSPPLGAGTAIRAGFKAHAAPALKGLDSLTAGAEAWAKLEEEMRQDAKDGVKQISSGDFGKFMDYPAGSVGMLAAALKLVKLWNTMAEYYGEEPADALERELADFIAKLDRLATAWKPTKAARRRGPRGASAENKELLEEATALVERNLKAAGYPHVRGRAAALARKDLKAKGLLPYRSEPTNKGTAYSRRKP